MKDYLIYDCEIIKCIQLTPGYESCLGWTDYGNMGISVIGFYSSKFQALHGKGYQYISESNYQIYKDWAIAMTNQHSVVIGHNSKRFDDKLLKANGINLKTTYDLLDEVKLEAGKTPKGFSYSLNKLGVANGHQKSEDPAEAPKLWQDSDRATGEEKWALRDRVIKYCLQDVAITHELFKLGLKGELIDPNNGRKLKLRSPFKE